MTGFTADILGVADAGDGLIDVEFVVLADRDYSEYGSVSGVIRVLESTTEDRIVALIHDDPRVAEFRRRVADLDARAASSAAEEAALPVNEGDVLDLGDA